MTDARLPERWLNDRRLQRLNGDSYKSFMNALMWSVANRTDGVIDSDDLIMIPGFDPASIPRMVDNGLFIGTGSGWLIADFEATQTSRSDLEVLETKRAKARERRRRERAEKAAKAQLETLSRDSHETNHATESVAPPGQDRDRTRTPRRGERQRTRARKSCSANAVNQRRHVQPLRLRAADGRKTRRQVERGYET